MGTFPRGKYTSPAVRLSHRFDKGSMLQRDLNSTLKFCKKYNEFSLVYWFSSNKVFDEEGTTLFILDPEGS